MDSLLKEIEKYSGKYQLSFQFWGEGNNNVFVEKNDVELYSNGGLESPKEAIKEALNYIYRVNRVPHNQRKF